MNHRKYQKYQKYQNQVLTVGVKSITPFRGILTPDTKESVRLSQGSDIHKPDPTYKRDQHELQILTKRNALPLRRTRLARRLEKEFMTAWEFTSDRFRLSNRLRDRLRMLDGGRAEGLDHCSPYAGTNDQRVIVTQPYGNFAAQLRRGLTLDNGATLEIILATEWAFYYPGHADLIILKFSPTYANDLEEFIRRQNYQELVYKQDDDELELE